ncbi:MAG: hypothetical protein SA339_11220 [Methanomassiliicoccus sp.]|nr:hypothetical protein [Methanomassiliicoccus sp.]
MRLIVLLVDAELESAPRSAADDRVPLLDAFYHREIMASLPGASRRGRGDIVHNTLLLCQGSALNRAGRLKVIVHTRDDKVIEVDEDADVHPNYIRFLQDMGELFKGEKVPGYRLSGKDLRTVVHAIETDLVVALSPSGEEVSLKDTFGMAGDGTVLVLIGAFPEGDFASPVYDIADVIVSLGPRLMRVPEVTSKVLHAVLENGKG